MRGHGPRPLAFGWSTALAIQKCAVVLDAQPTALPSFVTRSSPLPTWLLENESLAPVAAPSGPRQQKKKKSSSAAVHPAAVAVPVVVGAVLAVAACILLGRREKRGYHHSNGVELHGTTSDDESKDDIRLGDVVEQFKLLLSDIDRLFARLKSHLYVDLNETGSRLWSVEAYRLGPVVYAILDAGYSRCTRLLESLTSQVRRDAMADYSRGRPITELLASLNLGILDSEDVNGELYAAMHRVFGIDWMAWADVLQNYRQPSRARLDKYKADFANLLRLVANLQLRRALYFSVTLGSDSMTWNADLIGTVVTYDSTTMDTFSSSFAPADGGTAWILFPPATFHDWSSNAIVTSVPPNQRFLHPLNITEALDTMLASAAQRR